MSLMLSEYQKKLEDKNNAYNEQLGQILSAKNDQARAQKQIADLQIRLQEKEVQVMKIKKALYNLHSLSNPENRETQAKDLSLSITQQKTIEEKSKEVEYLKTELSLALKQSKGASGSDEIDFLKKGYQEATAQLKQKNEMLLRIQANADEYEKRFKEQSREFKTLKQQLREAREEVRFQDEDLKSRGVKALQAQLKSANIEIKDLQMQIIQLKDLSKNDHLDEKLTHALDKMNEQGRVINELNQKLQDSAK